MFGVETGCDSRFPKLFQFEFLVGVKDPPAGHFQPVGLDGVHRAEPPVEGIDNPEMVLEVLQFRLVVRNGIANVETGVGRPVKGHNGGFSICVWGLRSVCRQFLPVALRGGRDLGAGLEEGPKLGRRFGMFLDRGHYLGALGLYGVEGLRPWHRKILGIVVEVERLGGRQDHRQSVQSFVVAAASACFVGTFRFGGTSARALSFLAVGHGEKIVVLVGGGGGSWAVDMAVVVVPVEALIVVGFVESDSSASVSGFEKSCCWFREIRDCYCCAAAAAPRAGSYQSLQEGYSCCCGFAGRDDSGD